MEAEQKHKKSSRKLIIIIIIVLIVAGGVGYFIYEKGQQDMRERIRTEQLRQEQIKELKNYIPQKQAELQMAYNKLNEINGFQFLRTSTEKEQQLATQNKIINGLKDDLGKLQRQLNSLQNTAY
jgi:flagellar basal body-associated protein FliL